MTERKARSLLAAARRERDRLRRHLLVAGAFRELLPHEPVVVGGTAEEYWTADEYHETDLDLCVPLGPESIRLLGSVRFAREGRHWVREDVAVAVEFPGSRIDGDLLRTVLEPVGAGAARIIGVDDLYVDRLRQATMQERVEGVEFHSALAVAAACFDRIDWPYVNGRISAISASERVIGDTMRRIDSKIRRRVRRLVDE